MMNFEKAAAQGVAGAAMSILAAKVMARTSSVSSDNISGSQILKDLEGAAIDFVVGAPVAFKVNEPQAIKFAAKNELGVPYEFTISGAISIIGVPQTG